MFKTPWGKAETSRVGGRRGGGGILPKLGFHAIVGWSQSPLIFGTIGTIKMIRTMIWKIAYIQVLYYVRVIAIDPVALHQ